MPHRRAALGALGERVAAQWLEQHGYRVIARNVRADRVELDLIATQGRTVVIVEVKTRASQRHGSPAEAVDSRKQARLARGAAVWIRAQPRLRRCRVRFDVIACTVRGGEWTVEHWPDAFDTTN